MRYLVTGGAGFIGSHLAERLVAGGNQVTLLDDLSTGRLENIESLRHRAGVQFVRGSVEDPHLTTTLVADCDAVFHLASAVGVQLIIDRPVHTIRTIIRGSEVVLEAAHRFDRPVLLTSSSEVYGKGSRVPFREDDDVVIGPTIHSRWCYAYAKGIDEFLALAYHREFGTRATVVRLFNTVGPRQVGMYGMVLPRFVQAALNNQPLSVYGDGTQTRCFCHVHDVVETLEKLINLPEAFGKIFNLGGSEEISIAELAERVIRACGSTSRVTFIDYTSAYGQAFDDLPRRVPSLDRIREAVGFEPRFDLDAIIHDVIADLRR